MSIGRSIFPRTTASKLTSSFTELTRLQKRIQTGALRKVQQRTTRLIGDPTITDRLQSLTHGRMHEEEAGVGGARDLLLSLPLHTLLTLAQTVTHALVDARTQQDAVKAVILHSPDLESVLRRKVMTREILFQYLHLKGVSVMPSTVKQDLISKILSMWLEENTHTESTTAETSTEIQNPAFGEITERNRATDSQLQNMAQKFVQWFYPLLKEVGLHSDNFWENTELLLNLQRVGGELQRITFRGVAQVLSGLAQLVRSHGVLLQPSAAGGVAAEMDAHGLVLVTSRGTVHAGDACCGVYEQSFALASDPRSPGDWRIKRSVLDVRLESAGPGALETAGDERALRTSNDYAVS